MPAFLTDNLLTILTFLPALGALILLLLPRPADLPDDHAHGHELDEKRVSNPARSTPADSNRTMVNAVALVTVALTFLVSLHLFAGFNAQSAVGAAGGMQFVESRPWIHLGRIQVDYRMGIDGISMLLLLLTTFLMVLCVIFSFRTRQRLKEFMVFLLLLETGMLGVFCALDLVLFYFFWEAMLIPMYFLIGIFGHENRVYAAIKFFLYTFAGSVLMLIAIVAIFNATGTFNLQELINPASAAGSRLAGLNPHMLMMMFSAFALAFMIKVPMFPFHTWLPDAHVEAPTAGSAILAGVMLKMGTYGLIRFCIPLFPLQARQAAPLFIFLAIVGIIYASIVAAVQPDAKKLVAYSSVAHLGFVVLGIFSFTHIGMQGALLQNLNHGISTPMLFFIVGMLYERRHTRLIGEYGGLKLVVPMMATMLLLATLSSIAVPFFNGFAGEFPVLLGSWISTYSGPGPTAFAATGMILSAVYMLWWFQRIMLGPVKKQVNLRLPDLSPSEWVVLAPLVVMIFWLGLGSPFWSDKMAGSVERLLGPTPVSRQLVPAEMPAVYPEKPAAAEPANGAMQTPVPPAHTPRAAALRPRRAGTTEDAS